jgi:hypothetical protein
MDVDFADDFKDFLANAAKQAEAAKSQTPQIAAETPQVDDREQAPPSRIKL